MPTFQIPIKDMDLSTIREDTPSRSVFPSNAILDPSAHVGVGCSA